MPEHQAHPTTPPSPLSTMPLEGRRVVGTAGRAAAGGELRATRAPRSRRRGRPRSGRPQAPLEFVEEVLTSKSSIVGLLSLIDVWA
jgi:hypothetical protein